MNPHIPFARPDITEEEVEAVAQATRSGWLTTGQQTKLFEDEFGAAMGGSVQALSVNSATAGLHLALESMNITGGDEVLVPTWTFTATAEVVKYLGARPVLVDVKADTLNIDLEQASSKVTERTRAIIPVHFAGLPAKISHLHDFANHHRLRVVEDAAHAFPVSENGTMIGNRTSDATVFSFYATKTMTTGEGGMVVLSDPQLALRIEQMRLHGIDRDVFNRYRSLKPAWKYDVVAAGYKYNMTDLAASIGRVQLRRADAMRALRNSIANAYSEAFSRLPLELPKHAATPDGHAWHLYVARVSEGCPLTRDQFIAELAAMGVGTSVHFRPLHLMTFWRRNLGVDALEFPIATREYEKVLSLPIYSAMTDSEVERVIAAVQKLLAR